LPERKVRFDWWGAITLGISLAAIVLVLDRGTDWGWLSADAIISYVVFIVSGVLFYFIERHHDEPIVDLKFFQNPVFVNVVANNFIVFMAMMGSIFLVPIFAQTFLGYTATQSGLLFMPMALGLMIAAPLGGALTGRFRTGTVIAVSTWIAALGIALFAFLLDARSTALDIMIPLAVMAFGMGFGMAQRTSAIANAVDPSEIGIASGVLALARNIAGAFGIALFSTLLDWATYRNIFRISSLSNLYQYTPIAIEKFTALIELKAQIDAYAFIYLVAAIVLAVGGALALFIDTSDVELTHEQRATAEM